MGGMPTSIISAPALKRSLEYLLPLTGIKRRLPIADSLILYRNILAGYLISQPHLFIAIIEFNAVFPGCIGINF